MRVLEKHEQVISNHCVVCGQGLDRNRQDIVLDVGIDFDLPGHPLDGRKYVCQGCVFDIARATGLLTATQLNETKDYLRRYRNEVEQSHELAWEHIEEARKILGKMPAAPNLDHLDTPAHVLVAEENANKTAAQHKDWVEVDSDEAPF